MSEQLERNKQTAIAFYDLMFNQGKPAEAVRKYVGDTYIQHNPGVADGKEAFIRFFKEMAKDLPEQAGAREARHRRGTVRRAPLPPGVSR